MKQSLVLIEPESTFADRHAPVTEDVFAFTQADDLIYAQLRAGPQRLTTVLNTAARMLPTQSKRHHMAAKREILLRLGALIRAKRMRRIRRISIAI
ncbi:MAG: hypothetical protein KJ070_01235 [Verrucomicrobia bacterium]|nr:hypothetical protein [Verrucomicrobiota bacterium]